MKQYILQYYKYCIEIAIEYSILKYNFADPLEKRRSRQTIFFSHYRVSILSGSYFVLRSLVPRAAMVRFNVLASASPVWMNKRPRSLSVCN